MELVSLCPLPVAHLLWQPAPSRHALTIVCKATYALEPGTAALAPEQEPLNEQENHWDDDPARSLYAPSDLVPWKPRAEVLLVGSAHAPRGQPVRSLVVRLTIGPVDKSVEVVCPRVRTRDGELREGKRWTKMPLLWERAAGGPDTYNPVGVRRDAPRDLYGQRPLPNLQAPGLSPDAFEPIGLGPIAAGWSDRRRRAGGLAPADLLRAPFGEGFDPAYFQAAPADQQVEALRHDERLSLENLLPKHAHLVTSLPDLLPRALVEIAGAPAREVTLAPDTLWIDTHRSLCTVTFRGRVDVDGADPDGRILVAAGRAEQKIAWSQLAPPPPAPRPASHPASAAASLEAPAPRPGVTAASLEALAPRPGATAASLEAPAPRPAVTAASLETPAPFPASRSTAAAPLRPVEVPAPRPAPASDPEGDPDGEDSLEITRVESDVGARSDTAELRRTGSARAARAAPLPFQPPPPAWQVPAVVTFGPAPAPLPHAAKVSTQKLDMSELRSSLPAWLQAGAPPPLVAGPAPPALVPSPAPVPASVVAPGPVLAVAPIVPAAPPLVAPPAPVWAPPLPGPGIAVLRSTGEAPLGVMDASNSAAGATDRAAARPEPEARAVGAPSLGPAVELIWFDPALAPALRRRPQFAPYQRTAPPRASAEVEAELLRAEVYDALTRGLPAIGAELQEALEAAEDEGPPATALVLVSGDLELGLDEVATLAAVVEAAGPLGASDKKLKEALDLAAEMLKTPLRGMPEIAEALTTRVREAWTRANRALPPGYLVAGVERLLLEQRRYQLRELLDGAWIRALLSGGGLDAPVPVYLPAAIARRLPLFQRLPVRLLAEVVWSQDPHEAAPIALRVGALGRLSASTRGRRAR
jgi:hypothetical protein